LGLTAALPRNRQADAGYTNVELDAFMVVGGGVLAWL